MFRFFLTYCTYPWKIKILLLYNYVSTKISGASRISHGFLWSHDIFHCSSLYLLLALFLQHLHHLVHQSVSFIFDSFSQIVFDSFLTCLHVWILKPSSIYLTLFIFMILVADIDFQNLFRRQTYRLLTENDCHVRLSICENLQNTLIALTI